LQKELSQLRKKVVMLEQLQAVLNASFESTADGLLVISKDGNIVSYNNKFLELWQVPSSVAEQRDDNTLIDFLLNQLQDPQAFLEKTQYLHSHPEEESFDVLECKDSRVFERYSEPQKIGENIIGRVWSFRDVTERKRTEGLIQDVFEGIGEGLLVIDKEYRIVSANRTFTQQADLPLKDVLGKYCYECSHHKNRPCYEEGEKCPAKHTFETGEPCTVVHTHIDAEGNSILLEVRSFPLKDPSGKVISAIETIQDITEQRKLEAQLFHIQKMEAIGTLVGGIAHDFNNLLNIIIGYSEMIRINITEKNATRAQLDEILMAAHRATQLTKSLLAFSRRQTIETKPVNINDIVNSIRKRLSRIIGKGRELKTNLTGEDITIHADFAQIEQVLMNLAINARDAMSEGDIFSINTELVHLDDEIIMTSGVAQSGTFAIITVADTGIGMDEQTTRKIYEPYFTTKEMDKGTGLGLSIVYGIIKQHNGFIDVISHPGKGTTFNIYLPVIQSEPGKTTSAAIPEARGGTEVILLVEDDSSARKLTRVILEKLGYNVIEAVDGEDALKKFLANKDSLQLVILDVIMPQGSIKQVYDEMLNIRPDIKAIFISGYTEDILKKNGMIEAGLHFLPKPILPSKLSDKVREVLDS
jgi:PAS domain S-box-containing protein